MDIGVPILSDMEWPQIIKDLGDAGMSQKDIAEALGITQPSVSAIATGTTKRPSFEVGSKLLELHRAKLNAPRTKAAA